MLKCHIDTLLSSREWPTRPDVVEASGASLGEATAGADLAVTSLEISSGYWMNSH